VALPVSVCLGPWPATLVLAAIVLEAVTGTFLLNSEEKRGFAEGARRYLERVAMMASLVRGSHAR
jgi:hypothetical protein